MGCETTDGPNTGEQYLLLVNTAPCGSPEVYTPVGGQRGGTLDRSLDNADVTTKDSNGDMEFLPTLKGWTASLDGVVIADDNGLEKLKMAWRERETIKVVRVDPNGSTESGDAILSSLSEDFPYESETTYSVELQGTGPLTPGP